MNAGPERARDELVGLARAAGRGDTRALTDLVHRTSPTVWRACAALVDRASAEDLTQDTYLRAIRSLPTFRGECDPTRWLLTIARRVCAEEISRRQRSRATLHRLHAEPQPLAGDPAGAADLDDALARLRPERREALVLTAVAGLSYAEAALVCGCPIGTIRSRVARARTDLITRLSDTEPVPERRPA
jgi:RNA polymerase sigma-70 factor (ECF subfamily)